MTLAFFLLMLTLGRPMKKSDSAISLIGAALTLVAWINPENRISYDVKFTLFGAGLTALCLGLWLLTRDWWLSRGKQKALDQLSEVISRAIHELINKPRLEPAQMDGFAKELAGQYDEWCKEVNQILSNRSYFTYSDFSYFDRLGIFQPIVMTRHPGADHTLAMLKVKIERLREIIVWNR